MLSILIIRVLFFLAVGKHINAVEMSQQSYVSMNPTATPEIVGVMDHVTWARVVAMATGRETRVTGWSAQKAAQDMGPALNVSWKWSLIDKLFAC